MSVGLLGRDGEDVSGSLTTRPFGLREKLPLPHDFQRAGEEHLTRLRLQFEERVSQPVSIRCHDPWRGGMRIAKNAAPFLACDLLVLVTAIAVAGSLTAVLTQGALFGVSKGAWLALGGLATLAATGNYLLMGTSPVVELRRLAVGTTAFVAITLVVFRSQQLPFVASALFASLNCVLLLVGLMAARVLLRSQLRRCSWWGEPLLILGEPQACQRVYDRVQREAERGLRPIILHTGYAKPDASRRYIRIKSEEQVSAWVRRLGAAWAIIAEPTESEDVAMWRYLAKDVPHVLVERNCTLPSLWTQAKELGSSAALYLRNELAMPVPCAIKRTADVLISGALLILLLPLFVAIATAILLVSRGP
ncbi:MAG: hypothetical protein AAGF97_16050, partial [Planctomycetota bacterium]